MVVMVNSNRVRVQRRLAIMLITTVMMMVTIMWWLIAMMGASSKAVGQWATMLHLWSLPLDRIV